MSSSIGNLIFRDRGSLNLEHTDSSRLTGQLVVEILSLPPYPALECGVCCHALLGTLVLRACRALHGAISPAPFCSFSGVNLTSVTTAVTGLMSCS